MGDKINTLIGQDISIIGNIYYKGVIHIEGSVEGSLIANKDEDSKLYINKSSAVKGYVDAKNIAINGKGIRKCLCVWITSAGLRSIY
jgi:cytoskeletal protein CcmA (bactofilin family)